VAETLFDRDRGSVHSLVIAAECRGVGRFVADANPVVVEDALAVPDQDAETVHPAAAADLLVGGGQHELVVAVIAAVLAEHREPVRGADLRRRHLAAALLGVLGVASALAVGDLALGGRARRAPVRSRRGALVTCRQPVREDTAPW
jgi:hypothetical protein